MPKHYIYFIIIYVKSCILIENILKICKQFNLMFLKEG
jgi:hypothetical protein